jgi:hypothetical protein
MSQTGQEVISGALLSSLPMGLIAGRILTSPARDFGGIDNTQTCHGESPRAAIQTPIPVIRLRRNGRGNPVAPSEVRPDLAALKHRVVGLLLATAQPTM